MYEPQMGVLLAQCVVAIAVPGLVTALFVFAVRRVHAEHWLWRGTDDVEGIYVTALSAIYAVILAFMIFVVWERFDLAVEAVDREALALEGVYRLAGTLPEGEGDGVQRWCPRYREVTLQREWATMAEGRESPEVARLVDELWAELGRLSRSQVGDLAARTSLLEVARDLTASRRERLFRANHRLPVVLWLVLLLGGTLTVGFAAMYGNEHTVPHVLKAMVLASLIATALFAIDRLDRPFSGPVHVAPDPLVEVQAAWGGGE